MKRNIKRVLSIAMVCSLTLSAFNVNAGNEDRSGQSGAAELLINPWARGTGWGNVNVANTKGVDALFSNVAGISFTNKTQVAFMNTQYLQGSGANINAFGFTQKIGKSGGVLGVSIFSMGFGNIPVTTVENPEGFNATFSPTLMNVSVAYSKSFSEAIHGGVNIKIINESISDMNASGVAFDAGIQYVTGKYNNMQFGISLKNIGTPLSFSGDGLSVRGIVNGSSTNLTLEQRSGEFELPSMLTLGFGYDFLWAKKDKGVASDAPGATKSKKKVELSSDNAEHRLTIAGCFISNAFSKDQYVGGIEYSWNNIFQLRTGYAYESDMLDSELSKSVYTGLNAGCSIIVPMSKDKSSNFSIDYAYRSTRNFGGCHTIGAVINL